jgi:integration host factor subunit beta
MTKADLIEEVSRAVDLTQKDSEIIVEAIFDHIVRAVRGGDKVEIRGFGSFHTRQCLARLGRNPKTGTPVEVPHAELRGTALYQNLRFESQVARCKQARYYNDSAFIGGV